MHGHKMYEIYIKRATTEQGESFIRNLFESKLGTVKDIQLIPKSDANGKSYNGAIVTLSAWKSSPEAVKCKQFLDENAADRTKCYKFMLNQRQYWYIIKYENPALKKASAESAAINLYTYEGLDAVARSPWAFLTADHCEDVIQHICANYTGEQQENMLNMLCHAMSNVVQKYENNKNVV